MNLDGSLQVVKRNLNGLRFGRGLYNLACDLYGIEISIFEVEVILIHFLAPFLLLYPQKRLTQFLWITCKTSRFRAYFSL